MKNQYFGDINDFRKYGLLRILSSEGAMKLGICWMLTPDVNSRDGLKRSHLEVRDERDNADPELLQLLKNCKCDVVEAEAKGLFRSTSFWRKILADDRNLRIQYFQDMLQEFRGVDLIFFDPDNGMEVKSRLYGRRNSSKYLYWSELKAAFETGSSVLVYQHFCREKRDNFIDRLSQRFYEETQAGKIISFRTPHVVFFLAVQDKHLGQLASLTTGLQRWGKQFTTKEHRF